MSRIKFTLMVEEDSEQLLSKTSYIDVDTVKERAALDDSLHIINSLTDAELRALLSGGGAKELALSLAWKSSIHYMRQLVPMPQSFKDWLRALTN